MANERRRTKDSELARQLDYEPKPSDQNPSQDLTLTPEQLDSEGSTKTEASVQVQHLFLLTAIARIFGAAFFLVVTLINFGSPLVAKVHYLKDTVKGLRARFGFAMFCLQFIRLWLKDVPVENNCAR